MFALFLLLSAGVLAPEARGGLTMKKILRFAVLSVPVDSVEAAYG